MSEQDIVYGIWVAAPFMLSGFWKHFFKFLWKVLFYKYEGKPGKKRISYRKETTFKDGQLESVTEVFKSIQG